MEMPGVVGSGTERPARITALNVVPANRVCIGAHQNFSRWNPVRPCRETQSKGPGGMVHLIFGAPPGRCLKLGGKRGAADLARLASEQP